MNLGELVVNLGVRADTFTVRDFGKAIGDIPFSVATAVTSMAGLSLSFIGLTEDVLHMTTNLQTFTAETGLNTAELQKWETAAQRLGLQASVAENFIRRISSAMGSLHTSHPDTAFLAMLGQLGVKDMSGNAYDIANRIQAAALNKPRPLAESLLNSAGFAGVMHLFDVPAAQRERFRPTMTTGDQAAMAEFTKALSEFNTEVMTQFVKVLRELEPYMGAFTEVMTAFIGTFGGFAARGLGQDAQIINIIRKGKFMDFLDNIGNSYLTHENLQIGASRGNFTHAPVIHMHMGGEQNPHALMELRHEFDRQNLIAFNAFNNTGNP